MKEKKQEGAAIVGILNALPRTQITRGSKERRGC